MISSQSSNLPGCRVFKAYCEKCLLGEHTQCLDWEMQCCDANVLLPMCSIPISKAGNKANEREFCGNILGITKVTF